MRNPVKTTRVAIPASEIRPENTIRRIRESEPKSIELALPLKYVEAVAGAGGLPVVVPPTDSRMGPRLLAEFDALLLPGGPDVDPANYGEIPHPMLGEVSGTLDQMQIQLARAALKEGLPILAICRGLQVLNVALGGSLVQHLPDEPGRTTGHRQDKPGSSPSHPVDIDGSSRLAAVLETERLEVNSFHHQAVRELGNGLNAVAWAPDGTVEAVEMTDRDFVLGVQWHAELMYQRLFEATLFSTLVASARPMPTTTTP
jgi:putative glutamine amidotransferase